MLQEFLSENPNDAFARYGLALEYSKAGDPAAALTEFNKLLELHPDYVPAYQMAAQTLLGAGREQEGKSMLHRGIACAKRSGNQHAQLEMETMLAELG
ncbi:MAG: tetratricopeptide repeat protein [Acidobacteria bacterium]|nr:tetratricopeptide repeat protein [Acidobacteriota bacterium]